MLSSQDGDTCEVHDQFYRDHKLLLVLFRALAVMPITRSRPGKVIEWHRESIIDGNFYELLESSRFLKYSRK